MVERRIRKKIETRKRGPSIREKVASSVQLKLEKLPPQSSMCSIYKVPESLRKVNEKAYTPRLVSVGPLHRGQPHLQAMERYKLRCLSYLLQLIRERNLCSLIDCATKLEVEVRGYYEDSFDLDSEKFVEMLLLDGVFIVVLFCMKRFRETDEENFKKCFGDDDDAIFIHQWRMNELLHDMMLLENQLPICVPTKLLRVCCSNFSPTVLEWVISINENENEDTAFFGFAGSFFQKAEIPATSSNGASNNVARGRHLVDYLRILHQPSNDMHEELQSGRREQYDMHEEEELQSGRREKFECTRSAAELQEAGVKFSALTTNNIFEIKFEAGVLKIPLIHVNEWTETLFRNLVAFEQCDHQRHQFISSYVIFMDSLINTPNDVDLLQKCGIIENSLGDSEQVSDLFNNLFKETVTDSTAFHFHDICQELNAYSKTCWHLWKAEQYRWKVILKRDYFSNPWKVMSVIAAVVLLVLTAVQTVCSVMALEEFFSHNPLDILCCCDLT